MKTIATRYAVGALMAALAVANAYAQVPASIATPDKVETHLSTLNFKDGFPDAATSQKLFDELDYIHGVDAFINGYAAVKQLALRKRFKAAGVNDNDVLVCSGPDGRQVGVPHGQRRHVLLLVLRRPEQRTPRHQTPPEALGIFDDMWWKWIADFGQPGASRLFRCCWDITTSGGLGRSASHTQFIRSRRRRG